MVSEDSFWFRVGYALERARDPGAPDPEEGGPVERVKRRVAGLAERENGEARPGPRRPEGLLTEQLLTAGVAALTGKLLDVWQPKQKTRFSRLLWAGAAGGAAALLIDLVKPLLRGEPQLPALDRATADRLLAGFGQGLVYGGVVEPRVPGPAVLKGALFGSAEYAADAAGGLTRLLGPHAPHGRLPLVGRMFEDVDPRDRVFLEHLAFGVVLALLYGSTASSNGIAPDDDEE